MSVVTPYPGPSLENLARLPHVLTLRPQWVLWRGSDRIDHKTGVIKLNKTPINPQTLTNADSTDPTTWGTFVACTDALQVALEEWETDDPAAYRGGGIGFVFSAEDPYVGIDCDGCVDPVTGTIEAWAQTLVESFASYTEITPSGCGLHILVEGTLPPKGRKKGAIEMYSYARFFTMTGWQIEETPETLEARPAQLASLWCSLFGATAGQVVWTLDEQGNVTNFDRKPWVITQIAPAPSGEPYAFFAETTTGWPLQHCEVTAGPHGQAIPAIFDDTTVIQKAIAAGNKTKLQGLAAGHWETEYPSHSEADLAFCCMLAFWTQDAGQIDRLFRTTGLMRPKWDEKRGALTYGASTIAEAFARQTEHYAPNPSLVVTNRAPVVMNGDGEITPPPAAVTWGTTFQFDNAIHARDLMKMMRVPARFLVDRLVPDGLTILAAPAKSYKSYFSLSLALATVGEGDWCDTFPVEQTGNVVFFGLEAPPMQLRNRLYQLRPHFAADRCAHDLIFFSGMQCLPTFKNGLQDAIAQVIDQYTPRLIVIDPLSYLYRLGRQDDLASATLDLLWPLAEMASKAQVAIFAPEHMRKRSKEDVSVVDQLAGSHIKAAIVHGLLMVHREGDDIIVETTMRDASSQELALTLAFDEQQQQVLWGYKGANATLGATRLESIKLQALGELKAKRYPMKVLDLITSLALPNTENTKSNLRMILGRAEKDGDVAQSKRGEYYWIGA